MSSLTPHDFQFDAPCPLTTRIRFLNVVCGVGTTFEAGEGTVKIGSRTNAIGFSAVDPGRSLENIETCASPIGDSLDMSINSCDLLELVSSSIFDIHRIMELAV
jgi:hypothetical protein